MVEVDKRRIGEVFGAPVSICLTCSECDDEDDEEAREADRLEVDGSCSGDKVLDVSLM